MTLTEVVVYGILVGLGLVGITRLTSYFFNKDWSILLLKVKGGKPILESLEQE